jgi:tetratricopeptide (TPR) repeat protein
MATKTRDTPTQLSYMLYLIQVAGLYRHRGELRARLLQEAGYWLRRLARARAPLALLIKGHWYLQQQPADVTLEDLNLMMSPALPTHSWRKAKQCFQKAIAASGSMEAHYALAMVLAERKPTKSMMASFRMAADQYHPMACFVSFFLGPIFFFFFFFFLLTPLFCRD